MLPRSAARTIVLAFFSPILFACPASGGAIDETLLDLSLEEILSLEVESVSKHSESYFDTPSSIYVLEREDIHRSGATRLVELLQLVPGATFTDNAFDQPQGTVRGFPGPYSSTMLVLLDRVPVLSPMTGSFFFSNFYIDLEEIERIEVIQGPGGAVYGANATTGVISIFTRSGLDEENRAQLETGSNGLFSSTLAGGTSPGDHQSLRGWIKYFEHDGYSRNPNFDGRTVYAYSKDLGTDVPIENRFALPDNDVSSVALGITHELSISPDSNLESRILYSDSGGKRYSSFHEEYPAWPGPALPDSVFLTGENSRRLSVSSRYAGTAGRHAFFALASFRTERMEQAILGEVEHELSSADIDIQDRVEWGNGHRLDLGVTARRITFRFEPRHDRSWSFSARRQEVETLYSGHAQNRWRLGRRLNLLASCKAELWSVVGRGAQISAALRSSYRVSERVAVWGAFSRNLANPSYREAKVEIWTQQIPPAWVFVAGGIPEELIPLGAGHWLSFLPSQSPDPTEYLTSELGVRSVLGARASLEATTFYSSLHDQTSAFLPDLDVLVESEVVEGEFVIPIVSANNTDGWMAGGEAVFRYRWSPRNQLEASHSIMLTELRIPEGASATDPPPKHQFRLRGYLGLPARLDLTVSTSWSSDETKLAAFNYVTQKLATEEYGGVVLEDRDTRWKLDLALERSFAGAFRARVWGRNLLTDPFVESFPAFDLLLYPQTVERTFGVALTYEP